MLLIAQAVLICSTAFMIRTTSHENKGLKMAITFKSERLKNYFDLPLFVVVGATEDRSKIGNKVLRCLLFHKKNCICLNKRLPEIEEAPTIPGLAALASELSARYPAVSSMSQIGINLITPPEVSAIVIRQAYELGVRNFFCQPETIDGDLFKCKEFPDANIIEDCVLVQLNEDHAS